MILPDNIALHVRQMSRYEWFSKPGQLIDDLSQLSIPIEQVRTIDAGIRVLDSVDTSMFLGLSAGAIKQEYGFRWSAAHGKQVSTSEMNRACDMVRVGSERVIQSINRPGHLSLFYPRSHRVLHDIIVLILLTVHFNEHLVDMNHMLVADRMLADGHCVFGWRGEFPNGMMVVH